ncbi:efflux RND transporter permease subunit [uncultured Aquimarina sp.]|uniref:efflux RND transporter permease subunit n=1 Tax=uncultured Aquimarina sp. TaxID=575652 RepID=UPI0026140461|nr:efflux RND transporter permease subunit [uncultured Aquimarina sp.]
MKNTLRYFLKNPMVVNITIAFIILIGLLILGRMRSTFFPEQKIKFITVDVLYRGASPAEMEEGIINKIEDNLQGVTGIDRVTSTAIENNAKIRIEIYEDVDEDIVLEDVKSAVNSITTFPERAEIPVIQKEEILNTTATVALSGNVSVETLKDYAKEIRDDFLQKKGLSKVLISGYPEEEIEVRLRENDLRRFNISFDNVAAALRNANVETSGGELKTPNENILIRADEKGYYANDLQNIPIRATTDGQIIYVKDIADVVNRFADRPTKRYLNGKPAVALDIFTLNEENIIENADFVTQYIDAFNKTNTEVKGKVVFDNTVTLRERIVTLSESGILGVILVIIVLTLFLNRSLALWVSFKIPVALFGMLIIASFVDLTINVVSLFGTIIVLGILVDDGVVIGENIYQHAIEKGKSRLNAAIDGTVEVLPAVISSLLTTAVAFSIYFFIEGKLGEFFSNISIVVIATLTVAMIESFFFLPVHIAHSAALNKNTKETKLEKFANRGLLKMREKAYLPALRFAQKNFLLVIGIAIVFLAAAIFLKASNTLKGTFFPNIDRDVVQARLTLPPGTPEDITEAKLQHIESSIWKVNEDYLAKRPDIVVLNVERIIGPNSNEGFLNITLLPVEQRRINSIVLSGNFRDKAGSIPEAVNLAYGPPAETFGKPISIALLGDDLEVLRKAKNELKEAMRQRIDIRDVIDTDKVGIKELYVTLKPNAYNLGLTLSEVMRQVRNGFFGVQVQDIQRGDDEIKIWLRYAIEDRSSLEKFKNMQLRLANNRTIPLYEVAKLDQRPGTLAIYHQQGKKEIRVEADIVDPNAAVPDILSEIQTEALAKIEQKYAGISHTFEGESRESGKSIGSVGKVGPLILLLMVAIVMLSFRSVSQTVIVFLLFPFMLIGVFIGHIIHGIPLSIFSIQGIIALIGILINNSLVMVSTFNQEMGRQPSFNAAVFQTAKSRFRAILLTTVTTIAGLTPLILSSSFGAQFLKPTAISIAYGLAFGMFITLLLLPSLLIANNHLKRLWHRLWEGESTTAGAVEPAIKRIKHQIK